MLLHRRTEAGNSDLVLRPGNPLSRSLNRSSPSSDLVQDQARKALEGALGGKKTEFDKWNKEIEKRNAGGGGKSGNGGWFGGGGGGWFGWFNDENFRNEAKQAALTVGALLSLVP